MDDFARFFDNSLDLNGIANTQGYFRRVNIAWERTLGWTADEITSTPWIELVHPEDRDSTMEVGERLFLGTRILSFENRYRAKDGGYRLIQWHAETVGGEAYCSGRDITEERSRLELRALIDNLPELAWTARPDGFMDFYNRRWHEYTGRSYEDMQGWSWQSVLDPKDLPRVMEGWDRSIATHQPFDQSFRIRRKDGVFRWFLTRVAPMFDRAGALIRWVGINTDVDDLRRVQDELTEMADVVESADDAIISKDLDGRIRSWNSAAMRLLGYAPEEIVGLPVTTLIPEDRWTEELEILEQIGAGKHVRHFETVRRRKNGSQVDVSLTVSPIRGRSGAVVAASTIMHDITERNQYEQERTRLLDQLQVLNVGLEERVKSRTSELSRMLRERDDLLQEKTSLLQEIHHRVKNNLQMISSLLNLQGQSQQGGTRAMFLETQGRVRSIALLHEILYHSEDFGRVNMQEYVEKLLVTLKRTYDEVASNVRFVTQVDGVHLSVDLAVPCGLILNELVTNALKHAFVDSPETGLREVRVEMKDADDYLTLTVEDNGRGFDARAPSRDETMGLMLVRDLSAQLRGRVEFSTVSGARCTVRFPVPGHGKASHS